MNAVNYALSLFESDLRPIHAKNIKDIAVYFSGSHLCTFLNILTKVYNKIQLALSLINLLPATRSSAADRR